MPICDANSWLLAGNVISTPAPERFAILLGETQQERGQPVTHRGEREFFDDPNQPAQARTDDPQHFQRYLRMGQAQCLKIQLADEEQLGLIDSGHGRGIVSAIEDRKFGDGTARTINTEYLFAPAGRTLEDSHVPRLDDVQSGTGLAFGKDALSRGIIARYSALRKKTELAFR